MFKVIHVETYILLETWASGKKFFLQKQEKVIAAASQAVQLSTRWNQAYNFYASLLLPHSLEQKQQ